MSSNRSLLLHNRWLSCVKKHKVYAACVQHSIQMTFGPPKRQTVVAWGSRQPACFSVGLADLHLDPLRQQDRHCLYSRSLVPIVVLMCAACSVFAYQHADCFPKTLLICLSTCLAVVGGAGVMQGCSRASSALTNRHSLFTGVGFDRSVVLPPAPLSVGYLQVCSDKSTLMRWTPGTTESPWTIVYEAELPARLRSSKVTLLTVTGYCI